MTNPVTGHEHRRSAFARLLVTGLSDPIAGPFDIEDRTADLRAVMDALDLEQAVLLGSSEGG